MWAEPDSNRPHGLLVHLTAVSAQENISAHVPGLAPGSFFRQPKHTNTRLQNFKKGFGRTYFLISERPSSFGFIFPALIHFSRFLGFCHFFSKRTD